MQKMDDLTSVGITVYLVSIDKQSVIYDTAFHYHQTKITTYLASGVSWRRKRRQVYAIELQLSSRNN